MKYILLSGCNGGIGKAIRNLLLEKGYFVFGIDLNDDGFSGKTYSFFKADVTNEEEIIKIKDKILESTNNLYAVINATGIFKMEPVSEGNVDDFKKIMNVNVCGPFIINKTFLPFLIGQGRIINLTSEVARYSPQPFNGYYSISKVSLDSYNDVLRRECAYIGVKVIKLQSGAIKTGLLGGVNGNYEKLLGKTQYFKKPLTKLKYMMDKEITKENDPIIIGKCVLKILEAKKPKICYRVKNSASLQFLDIFPETTQDYIYKKVIK